MWLNSRTRRLVGRLAGDLRDIRGLGTEAHRIAADVSAEIRAANFRQFLRREWPPITQQQRQFFVGSSLSFFGVGLGFGYVAVSCWPAPDAIPIGILAVCLLISASLGAARIGLAQPEDGGND